MGVERWIAQQLHPETIDDSALDAKLNALPAMRLSTDQLIWRYPPAAMIRQVDAGRFGLPGDPVERAIYANALANYRQRQRDQGCGLRWRHLKQSRWPQKQPRYRRKLQPIDQRCKLDSNASGRALEFGAGDAAGDGAAVCAAADSGRSGSSLLPA